MTTEPDPSVASLEDQFPGWHAWRGVNGMLYGQLRGSPPVTFCEENSTELRARIASWYRTQAPCPVTGDWPRPPWETSASG
jgi:hypothetical protein